MIEKIFDFHQLHGLYLYVSPPNASCLAVFPLITAFPGELAAPSFANNTERADSPQLQTIAETEASAEWTPREESFCISSLLLRLEIIRITCLGMACKTRESHKLILLIYTGHSI